MATASLSLGVAVLLVLIIQLVLETSAAEAADRVLENRADAVAQAVESGGDRVPVIPPSLLGPGVAVYDGAGRLVAGSVPPAQAHEYEEMSRRVSPAFHSDEDDYRLRALPVQSADGAFAGVVVVSESLEPYEGQERNGLLTGLGAALVIVVLPTGLAAWASRRALAPVAEMARTADEWSAHDLGRRFDLGPPTDEIKALGHTLDGLLERVARAIGDEQRLTSELAHELRTPLAAILSTAEVIALSPDLDDELRADLGEIISHCRSMATTITGLLDIARASTGARASARCRLEDVVAEVLRQVDRPEAVTLGSGGKLALAMSADTAVRALVPVVANAVRHGTHVLVDAVVDGHFVMIAIRDDGPGVPAALHEHLFEPGASGSGGSGLGLALARRVARSAGGDVVHDRRDDDGGAVFQVRLPTEI
ncbi:sensor histidine kinase [Nocardioides stalactiti]|uniref:sensor histidine kinase n=1 Tax=Nocardioides stalactiti TaxID=2755356 RepID=UPI001600F54F|nr:HAMP domain-containing sensor histidine kinase [Nocardioides stalactiti]